MKHLIMAFATLAAVSLGTAAQAQSTQTTTSETRCSRDKWTHAYNCWSNYDSPYSTATTYCSSGRGGSHCDTQIERKPQPMRPDPIVQDPRSTRIMDGHGPR